MDMLESYLIAQAFKLTKELDQEIALRYISGLTQEIIKEELELCLFRVAKFLRDFNKTEHANLLSPCIEEFFAASILLLENKMAELDRHISNKSVLRAEIAKDIHHEQKQDLYS